MLIALFCAKERFLSRKSCKIKQSASSTFVAQNIYTVRSSPIDIDLPPSVVVFLKEFPFFWNAWAFTRVKKDYSLNLTIILTTGMDLARSGRRRGALPALVAGYSSSTRVVLVLVMCVTCPSKYGGNFLR